MGFSLPEFTKSFKNCLFSIVNKQFLVFLFFLALSGIFWLLMALNETCEKEFSVGLRIVNIPDNAIIIDDVPPSVKVTLRDKGYMIAVYMYVNKLHDMGVDFKTYSDNNGRGNVSAANLTKILYSQLYKSTKIVSVKNDIVRFSYNFGQNKRIGVRLNGKVKAAGNYYLSRVVFTPDSVAVFGDKEKLDCIKNIFTEKQSISNVSDTMTLKVKLGKIKGVKLVPEEVSMKLFPDVLIEEVVDVPVEAINMPEDKTLRTFPSKVRVHFAIGASILRRMPKNKDTNTLKPNGFRIVVDYNSIKGNSEKCRIYLKSVPAGTRNARMELSEIDYLIEQT